MPIYEYSCRKCDHEFETLVMRTGDKIECPACGSAKVKRLMSGFAHKSEGKMVSAHSGCTTCSSSSCAGCH
jgi:putative FmdB family regulatory protein